MSIYFASDFHLGLDYPQSSRERETIILSWLDSIKNDAEQLFILGDLFDYWFEYKQVVPKGFVRTLSKLAELVESKIQVHLFTGNHDLWMFDYLEKEIGLTIYKDPIVTSLNNKKFFLGHGDGLGPGDHGYKVMKKVFQNRLAQWMFARLHPNFGIRLMRFFSQKSRESEVHTIPFLGNDKEWLIQFCESKLKQDYFDYFIFGHRHLPLEIILNNKKSKYFNTGDWLYHFSYVKFENQKLELKFYTS